MMYSCVLVLRVKCNWEDNSVVQIRANPLEDLTRVAQRISEPNSRYSAHHVDYCSSPLSSPPNLNSSPLDITCDHGVTRYDHRDTRLTANTVGVKRLEVSSVNANSSWKLLFALKMTGQGWGCTWGCAWIQPWSSIGTCIRVCWHMRLGKINNSRGRNMNARLKYA